MNIRLKITYDNHEIWIRGDKEGLQYYEFINKSGKEITKIDIIHETGRFGEIRHSISNLAVGEERQIRMWAPAESSYKVVVTFGDQKQVTGGEGYIEPGYKITEIIEGDKIDSEVKSFGAYSP
jgi:hypothetical protein